MSTNNFIPGLWAAKLLENLNNQHAYAQGFNRDWEGEIKDMGSSVKINSIGRITISNYARNTDLAAPEELNIAGQWLLIDQGKTYNFVVDDLDAAQMRSNIMDSAAGEASFGLTDTVDLFLAAALQAGVPAANQISAATVGRGGADRNAYEVLVDLDVTLTENNTPRTGRWAYVPPWYEGMLRSDVRFVSYGTDANKSTLMGGKPIGEASGFTIYVTNNFPTSGGNPVVLAGFKGAATYAEQVAKQEPYRPEKRFGDAVKGLLVYGAKVTRPANLASIVATRGS